MNENEIRKFLARVRKHNGEYYNIDTMAKVPAPFVEKYAEMLNVEIKQMEG